ncbi:condensation domain-containing protein [Kitasatospora sp. HPMI-4]|uniref:condensation domain-containing protein n=1 Tax=Kitasatospora sp. HPMI-4 TaxID=3448443 RepID=UPI003F19D262
MNDHRLRQLPLSVTQEAMWVTWQLDPAKWEHIVPLALAVEGALDRDRLRLAVAALARRHPLLRARVRDTPAGLVLDWGDDLPVPVTVREVTGPREAALTAAQAPFDLARGPLARVEVLEGPDYTVLLITVHHLVLDGTSVPFLLQDLRRAYEGQELGGPDDLAPLLEHARRSREAAEGAAGERLRSFWREELEAMPAALPLPVQASRSEDGRLPCLVDDELAQQARILAKSLDISYFTVMLGALFVTLHHHTGGEDLIVSAPYHGRSDQALRGRVGFFVNVLPFRQRLRPSDSYEQVLRTLRSTIRAGLEHGALPLPAILRAARLVGPEARRHTHQVVFEYWDATLGGSGLDVHDFRLSHGTSSCRLSLLDVTDAADYRLTVMLAEGSTGSRMLWKDPAGTVGRPTVDALARDFLAVVADMAADPHRTLAEATARLSPVVRPQADPGPVPTGQHTAEPSAALAPLTGIWREVLRIEDISAEDSFFELGGHSLLATTLAKRITDHLGVELSVRDLFSHPKLGDLASVVDERLAAATAHAPAPAAEAADWADGFPATGFQESIWLAERLDPANARYHVPLFWQVLGELDPRRLGLALTRLVSRHEILRTRFVDRDGRLHHEVAEPWIPEVDLLDLSSVPEAERLPRLSAWADAAGRGFEPASGRLLAAALVTLPHGGRVLALCLHHLVIDGESVPVLLRELERCFGQAEGPAPRQYRELVLAQRTGGGRAGAAADLDHWRTHLTGAPSTLGLAAPAVPERHGNLTLPLDPDLARRLLPVRTEWGVSQFMINATALAAVLHRWSGLTDLTFGVPVAGRAAGVFDDVIGPCMNTLVLRSRCEAGSTLAELLQTVREEVIGAFEHNGAPFEEVVGQLRPARSRGRTPFVDCVLNSVGMTEWSGALGDARVVSLGHELQHEETSKFPFTVTFTETAGTVQGTLAYRGDCLTPSDAHRLATELAAVLDHFQELLPRPAAGLPDPKEL